MGWLPVAEEEATGEGDDEEDDRHHQFELLVLVFVGEPTRRCGVSGTPGRGVEGIW